jgi:DNA-binding transcriptional LysR family regulator
MTRFRRVAQLWNWLPAFRGVAEHQSIQRAALALGVSPSALSRTVRLLEGNLGAELFVRQPQGMRLTAFGEGLLAITRDAMRLVDDCVERFESEAGAAVRSISVGMASALIAESVTRALPPPSASCRMRLVVTDSGAAVEELLRGNIDVVFATAPTKVDELCVEPVGTLALGVYARAGHPLAARAGRIRPDELRTLEVVAPEGLVGPFASAAATSDVPEVIRALCERSDCLGILPDASATRSPGLVRLADSGESLALHASFRKPLARSKVAERVHEVVIGVRRALA